MKSENIFKNFYKQSKYHRFGDYLESLEEVAEAAKEDSDYESENNKEQAIGIGEGSTANLALYTGENHDNKSGSSGE